MIFAVSVVGAFVILAIALAGRARLRAEQAQAEFDLDVDRALDIVAEPVGRTF